MKLIVTAIIFLLIRMTSSVICFYFKLKTDVLTIEFFIFVDDPKSNC